MNLLNKDGTPASAALQAQFDRTYPPTVGQWIHNAIVGEGNKEVHCTFDVSSDGDIENLAVKDGAINVTPYLAFDQIEELELECFDSYMEQVKEHNTDLAINRMAA